MPIHQYDPINADCAAHLPRRHLQVAVPDGIRAPPLDRHRLQARHVPTLRRKANQQNSHPQKADPSLRRAVLAGGRPPPTSGLWPRPMRQIQPNPRRLRPHNRLDTNLTPDCRYRSRRPTPCRWATTGETASTASARETDEPARRFHIHPIASGRPEPQRPQRTTNSRSRSRPIADAEPHSR